MANSWITALKKYNEKKGGSWCVPKKGSAEYEKVKSLMASGNKIIDNSPVNPKMAAKSQLKPQPGLNAASGNVKKNNKKKFVIVKDKAGKAEMAAIAEARKIGGSINRIPKQVAQEFKNVKPAEPVNVLVPRSLKNVKPAEPVNVLVPRSLKKVTIAGSNVKKAFDEIMNRFQIKGDPKTYFIPGKLKKLFLEDIANTAMVYNVEGKLEELMEEKGPRLAISYEQNNVPANFKEAKSILYPKK
jgi:hypothetical protein